MKHKKIIKWVLLISWMIIIFLLSHQPYSGESTHSIVEKVLPVLDKESINTINFIIRKLAHFTEYFILTHLLYSLLKEYSKDKRKIIIISIAICLLYAITDEIHQLYIPGRTAKLKDIMIDTTGGIFYIALLKIKELIKKE